jgi:hypothetical protein
MQLNCAQPEVRMTENLASVCSLPSDGIASQKYGWSQTLQDITVCMSLPVGVSSKMLDVVFQRQSIKVAMKGGSTIFSGTLSAAVQPDECFWTLEKGSVEITLHKVVCLVAEVFLRWPSNFFRR